MQQQIMLKIQNFPGIYQSKLRQSNQCIMQLHSVIKDPLSYLLLTLLRTMSQKAMSESKTSELNSSLSVSSDRRRLAFTRYTLDTYGTFHTPLRNKERVIVSGRKLPVAQSASSF